MDAVLGWFVLAVVILAILLMAAAGIELALRAKDDDRVEELAEERFNDMVEHMEIRVNQQMWLVYGKGYEKRGEK